MQELKLENDFGIEEETKANNYSQFKLMKEDHTMGNLINALAP